MDLFGLFIVGIIVRIGGRYDKVVVVTRVPSDLYGHCKQVPHRYPQNPSLGMQVPRIQMESKKRDNGCLLTIGRIAILIDAKERIIVI